MTVIRRHDLLSVEKMKACDWNSVAEFSPRLFKIALQNVICFSFPQKWEYSSLIMVKEKNFRITNLNLGF